MLSNRIWLYTDVLSVYGTYNMWKTVIQSRITHGPQINVSGIEIADMHFAEHVRVCAVPLNVEDYEPFPNHTTRCTKLSGVRGFAERRILTNMLYSLMILYTVQSMRVCSWECVQYRLDVCRIVKTLPNQRRCTELSGMGILSGCIF